MPWVLERHLKQLFLLILASLGLPEAPLSMSHAQPASLPPASAPGQCFTRVVAPPVTETVEDTLLVRPETQRIERTPAVFEEATERVLVREATVEFRVVPAVFETVTETVMVEPERIELETVPAQYETYTETVIVQPEREVWKPGRGLYGRPAGAEAASGAATVTGGILCRVVEPAVTETVERVRLVTPPSTVERVVLAQFETIERRVMVSPARIEEVVVPAQYEDIPVRRLVRPAEAQRITVPAEYRTVTREQVVGGGEIIWAEVLCETNTTQYKVAEIQGALTDAGYPTLIDGIFGPETQQAMQRFQEDNALAEGYLTIETVRALGIQPYDRPPDLVFALLGPPGTA